MTQSFFLQWKHTHTQTQARLNLQQTFMAVHTLNQRAKCANTFIFIRNTGTFECRPYKATEDAVQMSFFPVCEGVGQGVLLRYVVPFVVHSFAFGQSVISTNGPCVCRLMEFFLATLLSGLLLRNLNLHLDICKAALRQCLLYKNTIQLNVGTA